MAPGGRKGLFEVGFCLVVGAANEFEFAAYPEKLRLIVGLAVGLDQRLCCIDRLR